MSRCRHCRGDGLVFLRYRESPGYDLASCVCPQGKWWRTKHQLRAKAASLKPSPVQIGRLEEFYTEDELRVLVTVYEQFDPCGNAVPRDTTGAG